MGKRRTFQSITEVQELQQALFRGEEVTPLTDVELFLLLSKTITLSKTADILLDEVQHKTTKLRAIERAILSVRLQRIPFTNVWLTKNVHRILYVLYKSRDKL